MATFGEEIFNILHSSFRMPIALRIVRGRPIMLDAVCVTEGLEFLSELGATISADAERKTVFEKPTVHGRCYGLCIEAT